jgi:hypothetical protein
LLAAIYTVAQRSETIQHAFATLPGDVVGHFFASTLDDEIGMPQALSQWRGKTVVVNFWASMVPSLPRGNAGFFAPAASIRG